jgi:predicted nucleic acid-binding protein
MGLVLDSGVLIAAEREARQLGRVIPFSDLLIGATALHFGYAMGTRNLRHFRMIPNLAVIQF